MTLRPALSKAIEELKQEVVKMADIVLHNIKEGLTAFKTTDFDSAKAIVKNDDEVDLMEEKIAKHALQIIWREQPVAKDLRIVTGILKIITDLERIGDHASDIAEMTLHLEPNRNQRIMPLTTKMAQRIENMLLDSINALVTLSEPIAYQVIEKDDEVDDLFSQVVNKISNELKNDKIEPNEAIYVLMVTKYFERIGDHAVNIAEWVIFIEKGEHKQIPLF